MAFTTKKIKEKEDILFKVKQSNPSSYLWRQKTFIERLFLVPQYLLAYGMMFNLYFLQYTVIKPHGLVYLIITVIGLFGDGTTYIQAVCLFFSLWAFASGIMYRVFLGNPKRLQWFYDIVGEKRVKPLLFQSPLVSLIVRKTAPAIIGVVGIDAAAEMGCEHQFQKDKKAALQSAQETWQKNKTDAAENYKNALETAPNDRKKEAAYNVLLTEQKVAEKAYVASYTEINSKKRTTHSFFRAAMQSERSKQVIESAEKVSTSVLGTIFWGGKK